MRQSKRLTYVSPEPERQGHASYTHVHEIIKGLKELGWIINLYCPRYRDNKALPGMFTRLFSILRTMFSAIISGHPDVYYMRWHFAAFPVALYAKIMRIPVAIEVNGPVDDLFIAWPMTRHFKWFFRWLMEQQLHWAKLIIAVTDGLNELCRNITDDTKSIVTIPNGANTDQFTPKAKEIENSYTKNLPEKFMIFFGTMAPWQGIGTVLKAIEDPAWPVDIHVVFAGDGAERKSVEASCVKLPHAHYLGRIPYAELPTITARAIGSFVCTENIEGRASTGLAPLKLFESMASGIAIIATDLPFQADVIKQGECGYLISPGNSTQLAQTTALIAADSAIQAEMGTNARFFVLEHHSWKIRALETHKALLPFIH